MDKQEIFDTAYNDNLEPEKETTMDAYSKETDQMSLGYKIEVMQAHLRGEVVQFCPRSSDPNQPSNWSESNVVYWNWAYNYYRVKPEEVTYDTMDWSNIDEQYLYVARDFNGTVYLYMRAPEIKGYRWYPGGDHKDKDYVEVPSLFTGHKPGNCDWKHSLIKRDAEDWTQIDQLLRNGRIIEAIKKYRDNGGRDGNGYLYRGLHESKTAIDDRKVVLGIK